MRDFWDARAREDAFYFVDNRRAYRDPEPGRFWADGERDLDALLDALGAVIEPTDVVLDIGCGVGRLTRVLAGRAARVIGLDVSPEMIAQAKAHHAALQNVDWITGDGTTLRPLEDASVDVCISHVVFQHLPHATITLGYVREMGRVLKPGGWAGFQVSNDARVHRPRRGLRARLRQLTASIGRGPGGQADAAWLGSAVALDELNAAAGHASLEIERVFGQGTQFCLIRARRHT